MELLAGHVWSDLQDWTTEKLESWVLIHNFLMLFTVLYGNLTAITVIHLGAFC